MAGPYTVYLLFSEQRKQDYSWFSTHLCIPTECEVGVCFLLKCSRSHCKAKGSTKAGIQGDALPWKHPVLGTSWSISAIPTCLLKSLNFLQSSLKLNQLDSGIWKLSSKSGGAHFGARWPLLYVFCTTVAAVEEKHQCPSLFQSSYVGALVSWK